MTGVMTWTPGPPREVGPGRRMLEVALCVAVWIGIGALINDGGTDTASASTINWYLLIGIPIVIVFQLWVRRRPLLELWVREGGRSITRPVLFRVLFVAAAIYPAYTVIDSFVDWEGGAFLVFGLTSIVGAAGFAYAYVHFDRRVLKYLAFCLGTAGVLGAGPAVVHDFTHSLSHPVKDQPSSDLGVFWISLLTYLPSLYVMEEVAFRGCFDSHAHHGGDRRGVLTAIYVSVIWGLWHAPVIGWDEIPILVAYQGVIGTFLSIWWRKSGNLGVSATTHAVIDSVRNASGAIP